jgi:hypothetical protein
MSGTNKIVAVINKMIETSSLIEDVVQGETEHNSEELFFSYGKKHKWSIVRRSNGEFGFWYYPGSSYSTKELAQIPHFEGIPLVYYSDADFKAPEATESIAELYRIVQEKKYGIDKLFEEILK